MEKAVETPKAEAYATGPVSATVENAAVLQKVVERHVIPRLVLRAPALVRPERFGDGLSEEVPAFTRLALNSDPERSRSVLHRLYEAGASFSQLQLGLLAPAAKRLDSMWRDDEVTFVDVTVAVGNLNQLMRFVALDLAVAGQGPPVPHSILLAPVPGERHRFGAAMAAEFFRRDGWNVLLEPDPTEQNLLTRLAGGWTDVLGLSVVVRPDVASLHRFIGTARAASMNPDLLVIAGGEAFSVDPLLVGAIGADATLAALPAAPARAHRLVSALVGARSSAKAG